MKKLSLVLVICIIGTHFKAHGDDSLGKFIPDTCAEDVRISYGGLDPGGFSLSPLCSGTIEGTEGRFLRGNQLVWEMQESGSPPWTFSLTYVGRISEKSVVLRDSANLVSGGVGAIVKYDFTGDPPWSPVIKFFFELRGEQMDVRGKGFKPINPDLD